MIGRVHFVDVFASSQSVLLFELGMEWVVFLTQKSTFIQMENSEISRFALLRTRTRLARKNNLNSSQNRPLIIIFYIRALHHVSQMGCEPTLIRNTTGRDRSWILWNQREKSLLWWAFDALDNRLAWSLVATVHFQSRDVSVIYANSIFPAQKKLFFLRRRWKTCGKSLTIYVLIFMRSRLLRWWKFLYRIEAMFI